MKTLKALALSALLVVGVGGFTAPVQAVEAETVARVVPVTAPEAVLTFEEPEVFTIPAPVEPVPAPVEPVVEPEPVTVPVTAPEPVPAPVAPEPVAEPVEPAPVAQEPATDPYSGNPIVDCEAQGLATTEDYTCAPLDYWTTPDGARMALFQGDAVEAFAIYQLDVPELTFEEQQVDFGNVYRGVYMAGHEPAGTKAVPSVINPATVYAYNLR